MDTHTDMLSLQQLKRLVKRAERPDGKEIRVALVGDTATQFLATALEGMALSRGMNVRLWEAEYNQVERQVLDPTSELHAFAPDYTIVFQSTHKLMAAVSPEERISFVASLPSLLPGRVVVMNYPEIDDTVFGSYANKVPTSFTAQVRRLNVGLMDIAEQNANFFVCDLAAVQAKMGRDRMFDASVYVSTEMVLSVDAVPVVASRVMDIIAAAEGRFKKCLILDLDNTLWGGVVGDDGWEGIQVGHGLGIGKAFTEFQQWVKKLKDRGIIVCVCSKNDEDKAKEPFERNPEMVLRLDDIAVFIANWDNKADNIRRIQSILNIGFDSMVFLDDNPFERAMVRENVPGVTVPELPEDPGDYLEYLYGLNLFETAAYSAADKDRTKQYQVEAQRVSLQQSFTNEADFLRSLDMKSEVRGFNAFNTPRVAQLSQRSNQFNLRTVRYTEADITRMEESPKYKTFSFTLDDRFGENGLICVIILEEKDEETLFVDTWFMSCRVLKRGMENFTLNTIVEWAREAGFKRIVGEYLPTAKNQMVAEHFPRLGFTPIEGTPTAQWELNVETYETKECYIHKI